MLIVVFYRLIIIIGFYILLGGFKLGHEVLVMLGVDATFDGI